MLCRLYCKRNEMSKRIVWLTIPCKLLRLDKLHNHERTRYHADTVLVEGIAAAAKCSGGIAVCLEEQVFIHR